MPTLNKEEMASAKRELISGVFFTAIARYAGIAVTLAVTAILARLLTPDDFGVVAIAVVIVTFFDMLSDMGIGPAVIQNRSLTDSDMSSIFSFTIIVGIVLSLVFFFSSSLLSSYYGNDKLTDILEWISLAVFFYCIGIVPDNLIKRDKKFKYLAKINIIVNFSCGGLAVLAALMGWGIYSLLVVPIMTPAILFCLKWKEYKIKPTVFIKWTSLKKIALYSTYQFLFSITNYFARNFDKLLVGKGFGTTSLGYYEKSYRLMMMPISTLSNVISPTVQPVFASFQDDKKWQCEKMLVILKFLAFVGFPISAFLFMCSKEIVLIVFGSQWEPAVPIFRILSISVGFQILYSPQGAFFQATNAVKEMFYCGLVTSVLCISSVIVGCYWAHSLDILALLIDISYLASYFITYYVILKIVFNHDALCSVSLLVEPLILSFASLSLLYVYQELFSTGHLFIDFFAKGILFCSLMGIFELKTKRIRAFFMQSPKTTDFHEN